MTMSRLAVNTTRLPSFFPGPKILYTKSSRAGEIFIKRTTRSTYSGGEQRPKSLIGESFSGSINTAKRLEGFNMGWKLYLYLVLTFVIKK